MIDIMCLAVLGLVTWCVASEGGWGAVVTCLAVIFSGLIAMNFFEPLAIFLEAQFSSWGDKFDFICLVGLFALAVTLIRLGTEQLAPTNVEMPALVQHIVRWAFALATGYVTVGFLLTALHTTTVPLDAIGFRPERKNFLSLAPDRQWLAFTQHVSEDVFPRRQLVQAAGEQRYVKRIFDGMLYTIPGAQRELYLPTFAIRYGTRRDMGTLPPPPPTLTPSSGSGGNAVF